MSKTFILKTCFAFINLVIFSIVINVFFVVAHINKHTNLLKDHIGVFGNSHAQLAVNSRMLISEGRKVKNFAEGGQGLLWTTAAMKRAYQNGCRKFIIEINPGILSRGWKSFDGYHSSRYLSLKYYLKPIYLFKLLIKGDFELKYKLLFKNSIYNNKDIGDNNFKQRAISPKGFREVNETVLGRGDIICNVDLLLNFVREYKDSCAIVFFEAPVNTKYFRYSENAKIQFKTVLNLLEGIMRPTEHFVFVDCRDDILDDCLFYDESHLNEKGSLVFTKLFERKVLGYIQ